MYANSFHANQMSYYPEVPQAYGATPEPLEAGKGGASAFVLAPRKRMNILPLGVALFLPWLLFCGVFAAMSFSLHYSQPGLAFTAVALGFLVVVAMGLMAADAAKKRMTNDPRGQPTWFVFLFMSCLIAWLSGMLAGDFNFFTNLEPFYDITNLNIYTSVDPASSRGQMLMDAGRILFTDDSRLDLRKSMGFKNTDTYCVAPVSRRGNATGNSLERLVNYDFWAVGINCCSSMGKDFHCGQFSNPHAHGGLRLMEDDQRAFFRLAVQQAEAAFNIKASQPLFFHWMQDPVSEVNAFQEGGYRSYLLGVCSFFVIQSFLVAVAVVAFSKLGH